MKQELAKEGALPWLTSDKYALNRRGDWTRRAFGDRETETILAGLLIWLVSTIVILYCPPEYSNVAYQIFVGM